MSVVCCYCTFKGGSRVDSNGTADRRLGGEMDCCCWAAGDRNGKQYGTESPSDYNSQREKAVAIHTISALIPLSTKTAQLSTRRLLDNERRAGSCSGVCVRERVSQLGSSPMDLAFT